MMLGIGIAIAGVICILFAMQLIDWDFPGIAVWMMVAVGMMGIGLGSWIFVGAMNQAYASECHAMGGHVVGTRSTFCVDSDGKVIG